MWNADSMLHPEQHCSAEEENLYLIKQISELEEKPFTSSLNICPETKPLQKGMGAGGVAPFPFNPALFPSCFVNISFKDDVTVILLLGVSVLF